MVVEIERFEVYCASTGSLVIILSQQKLPAKSCSGRVSPTEVQLLRRFSFTKSATSLYNTDKFQRFHGSWK